MPEDTENAEVPTSFDRKRARKAQAGGK